MKEEKKTYLITSFGNVVVGALFRYEHEWCRKSNYLTYLDQRNYVHPAPKLSTFVVASQEDCLTL